MSLIRETTLVVRNTLIIAAAVILGFLVGTAFGVPVWLQGFFLLPAGILFYKLSGDPLPPWWRMIGFLAVVSVFGGVFSLIVPFIPEKYLPLAYMVMMVLMPWTPMRRWLDRRFSRESITGKAAAK